MIQYSFVFITPYYLVVVFFLLALARIHVLVLKEQRLLRLPPGVVVLIQLISRLTSMDIRLILISHNSHRSRLLCRRVSLKFI